MDYNSDEIRNIIKEYLSDNLKVIVTTKSNVNWTDGSSTESTKVSIYLEDELISEDWQ